MKRLHCKNSYNHNKQVKKDIHIIWFIIFLSVVSIVLVELFGRAL